MKKITSIFLIGLLAVSMALTGCASSSKAKQLTTVKATEKATEKVTEKATEKPTEAPTTEEPTTEKPTERPTEKETEPKTTPLVEEEDYDLVVTNWTNTVEAGAEASVTIQGKPNTEYSISVFYHSGPSKAEGLEAKTSDGNGNVTWTWKVGTKTDKDTYDITVSGGGKHEKIQFTVV